MQENKFLIYYKIKISSQQSSSKFCKRYEKKRRLTFEDENTTLTNSSLQTSLYPNFLQNQSSIINGGTRQHKVERSKMEDLERKKAANFYS